MTNENTNRTITVASEAGLNRYIVNGQSLGEALEEALGYTPEPEQVRLNGAEILGVDLEAVQFGDGAMVHVLSQSTASKGVSGASPS